MTTYIYIAAILFSVGASAFRDLSRPEAWAYWKDLFFQSSLKSSYAPRAYLDQSGVYHAVLAIDGEFGPAAAVWFREKLKDAHLVPGDAVVLSSPGGDLDQAIIVGGVIRAHDLTTEVGTLEADGRTKPSYCASACVFAYAGGVVRLGLAGSKLGVHRFTTIAPGRDPVADTQRTAGLVLGYMTKMGVSSSIVEAMSSTRDIRWLGAKEAEDARLITQPIERP